MFNLEALQSNANTPTFYTALITVVFSFVLSICIAFTYEFTNSNTTKNKQFLQSLSLISIVAATIMLAVGDSLAIGLGMLGALSIIRFRTSLTNPRNITFIFAALASGIACGVLGYSIALVGTLLFCISSIILHYSPWTTTNELTGIIRLFLKSKDLNGNIIQNILDQYCQSYELTEIRISSNKGNNRKKRRYQNIHEYELCLKKGQSINNLLKEIDTNPEIKQVRFLSQKINNKL